MEKKRGSQNKQASNEQVCSSCSKSIKALSEIKDNKPESQIHADSTERHEKEETDFKIEMNTLKEHLNEICTLSKDFLESGVPRVNMRMFFGACEDMKAKLNKLLVSNQTSQKCRSLPPKKQERIKCDVTKAGKSCLRSDDGTKNSTKRETTISTSKDHCNLRLGKTKSIEFRENQNVSTDQSTYPVTKLLLNLKNKIIDIAKLTLQYKKQGLLSPSIEDFIKSCQTVNSGINECASRNLDNKKMNKEFTLEVHNTGSRASSFEMFKRNCDRLAKKLDDYKYNKTSTKPQADTIKKLIKKLDETINLARSAKESGLIYSESADNLIKSCENMKYNVKLKDSSSEHDEKEAKYNLDDVLSMITRCQAEGVVSESLEDFITKFLDAKSKMDGRNECDIEEEGHMIYPACNEDCPCDDASEASLEALDCLTPCGTCLGPCPAEEDIEPQESNIQCEICRSHVAEGEEDCAGCEMEGERPKPAKVIMLKKAEPVTSDSTLGYFENKVRRIIRVTRSKNPDGTIQEDKEVITIRTNKHEPYEAGMNEKTEEYMQDAALDDNEDIAEILTYQTPDVPQSNNSSQSKNDKEKPM